MRKVVLVALLLFAGFLVGVAIQPDDGTPVHLGRGEDPMYAGANHAKPLPRVLSPVDELVPLLATTGLLLGLAVVALTWAPTVRSDRGSWRRRELLASRALSRRGPPCAA